MSFHIIGMETADVVLDVLRNEVSSLLQKDISCADIQDIKIVSVYLQQYLIPIIILLCVV